METQRVYAFCGLTKTYRDKILTIPKGRSIPQGVDSIIHVIKDRMIIALGKNGAAYGDTTFVGTHTIYDLSGILMVEIQTLYSRDKIIIPSLNKKQWTQKVGKPLGVHDQPDYIIENILGDYTDCGDKTLDQETWNTMQEYIETIKLLNGKPKDLKQYIILNEDNTIADAFVEHPKYRY